MKALAELVVAVCDLVEAEGAALRRATFRLALAVAILTITIAVSLVGVALVLLGLYWVLDQLTGPIGAALVLGLVALIAAGGLAWKARDLVR